MSGESNEYAQWFFGRVTSLTAELYVRWQGADPGSRSRAIVQARLTGPRSRYARTLETSVSMTPVDDSGGLWHATLEDPCFWTPREPYLYSARLSLQSEGGQAEEIALPVGVPVLRPRSRGLELEGRNWILRAIAGQQPDVECLAACHASGTALCVDCPGEALCESASHEGVLLVADLESIPPERVASELRRLARWPAVGIAILAPAAELGAGLLQTTSHLIRAHAAQASELAAPRAWAQLLIVDSQQLGTISTAVHSELGIVVRSSRTPVASGSRESAPSSQEPAAQVARFRQTCDSLQAELAGRGVFAGYIVG